MVKIQDLHFLFEYYSFCLLESMNHYPSSLVRNWIFQPCAFRCEASPLHFHFKIQTKPPFLYLITSFVHHLKFWICHSLLCHAVASSRFKPLLVSTSSFQRLSGSLFLLSPQLFFFKTTSGSKRLLIFPVCHFSL